MTQFICNAQGNIPAATRIMSLMGSSTENTDTGTSQGRLQQPWASAGALENFRVVVDTAPGLGNSVTWTVYLNGSPTSLSVTISGTDTTGEDVTHSVTLADGDILLLYRDVTGTPTDSPQTWTAEFTPDTPGTSCYSQGRSLVSDSATRYLGLFTGEGAGSAYTTPDFATDIASIAGTVTRLRMTLNNVAGGPGESYTCVIYKNGVRQDGTGGTVDTTTVISGFITDGVASFSLPVSPGDTFYVECTPSSPPPFLRNLGLACEFVADDVTLSMFCHRTGTTLNTTTTKYTAPTLVFQTTATETDPNAFIRCGVTPFALTKMYAVLPDDAPGSGNNYTFTTRRNSATPSGALVVTIADAATAGNASSSGMACITDDQCSIQVVPTSSPTARVAAISCVVIVAAKPIQMVTALFEIISNGEDVDEPPPPVEEGC